MIFQQYRQTDFPEIGAEIRITLKTILSRFSVNLINLDQIITNTLHLIRIPE